MDIQNKNLNAIAGEYLPKVKKWIAFKLPDHSPIHDDLVQEIMVTFISAVQNGEFGGRSQMGTYIFGIAKNKIRDYLKHKKVRKGVASLESRRGSQYSKFDRIESDEKPDQSIEKQETAAILKELVKSLKPKYREVIRLYFYEQLPMDQIAQKLDITVKQAYNYMTYALAILRFQFKQQGNFDDFVKG